MDMTQVETIAIIMVAIGAIIAFLSYVFWHHGEKWSRLVAVPLALVAVTVIAAPIQQALCIRTEPAEGKMVEESWRIAEGGVSLATENVSHSGMGILAGKAVVPVGGGTSAVTRYNVMVKEDGSEGMKMKKLDSDSVTVYEDAETWEDAHLDKVLTVESKVSGTFFGQTVSDTGVSGNLVPDYEIHVPEGTVGGE